LAHSVDHDEIIRQVDAEARLRSSYLFMCVMSAGIATTGLLLNSPAVIIGAMLISPLMAPIVRLGLGVGTLDHLRAGDAVLVLAAGMAFALLTAVAIVWLSPIREITPEIAARTRPSLFDLVVAVLSGLAGGYAMVRGRGGAIVGVAIATALMPPMAVAGFGIASGEFAVARGAMLLFTTNLVAIALSVTAVSTWYGFSRRRVRHALVWQTALALILVLPLTVPLLDSLRTIALDAQLTQAVRLAVADTLGSEQSRILGLQVTTNASADSTRIDLALAAHRYSLDDDRRLRNAISRLVKGKLDLQLSPIVEADPKRSSLVDAAIARAAWEANAPAPSALAPVEPARVVLDHFAVPLAGYSLDTQAKTMRVFLADAGSGLGAARELEHGLEQRFPDWAVSVVPVTQALPPIHFAEGAGAPGPQDMATLDLVRWALSAWDVHAVSVYGFASSDGRGNSRLALVRARYIADRLAEDGLDTSASAVLPDPSQRVREVELGRHRFRRAEIVPRQVPPAPPE
jgi:uncharacterized hydrophobic protein (TIGR00271 family)